MTEAPEIRMNDDGTLDEVVASGADVQLEQMDGNAWFLGITAGGRFTQVWLRAKGKITAYTETSAVADDGRCRGEGMVTMTCFPDEPADVEEFVAAIEAKLDALGGNRAALEPAERACLLLDEELRTVRGQYTDTRKRQFQEMRQRYAAGYSHMAELVSRMDGPPDLVKELLDSTSGAPQVVDWIERFGKWAESKA